MNVECMRDYIAQAYPGQKWQQKVAVMHEPQVIAVYRNIIDREYRKKQMIKFTERLNKLTEKQQKPTEKIHQISIWEWMKENERNGSDQKRETIF